MAEAVFRSIQGTVEFDPREGQAGGKDVRNITVATFGLKDQAIKVGATLWPSHAHVAVKKGDIVALRGKFTQNRVDGEDGPKVYNNLSVTGITVLGTLDPGKKDAVENAVPADAADDDIPY